ncbi:MAG: hypothetical protein IPL93_11370 [Actinomycetales bacterium]|nr:hypothetical protein [Actinomycetales bacterium]
MSVGVPGDMPPSVDHPAYPPPCDGMLSAGDTPAWTRKRLSRLTRLGCWTPNSDEPG